jgi:hypothetical protein
VIPFSAKVIPLNDVNMSYFLAQIVRKAFEFRFSFFILAKRLKEALAGFKKKKKKKLVM